jgi:hypothetical protein
VNQTAMEVFPADLSGNNDIDRALPEANYTCHPFKG